MRCLAFHRLISARILFPQIPHLEIITLLIILLRTHAKWQHFSSSSSTPNSVANPIPFSSRSLYLRTTSPPVWSLPPVFWCASPSVTSRTCAKALLLDEFRPCTTNGVSADSVLLVLRSPAGSAPPRSPPPHTTHGHRICRDITRCVSSCLHFL